MDFFDAATLQHSNCNGRISWPEASSIKQHFFLPSSIIYYLAKNPSTPEVYLKLAQSCKYFFEKSPIIVAARIHVMKICSNKWYNCKGKCCVNVDISKIKGKIWLTNELHFFSTNIPKFASTIVPKLYQCENIELKINYSTVNVNDLHLLASKYKKFYFQSVTFIDEDGKPVMLDKVVEAVQYVKEFSYRYDIRTFVANAAIIKHILNLQNLGNLQVFRLCNIPPINSVNDIATFIKNYKDTKFLFHFNYTISISNEYKNQLDQLVDTVIASGVPNRIIQYFGQDLTKHGKMYDNYSF